MLVALTHVGFLTGVVSSGLIGHLLGRGDLGVGIFFGLSGFLLHRAMIREQARHGHVDVRHYLLRRAARILPAYWLALAVTAAFVRPDWLVVLANLFAAQIYLPSALMHAFTQTWSLATEISFYLVLPLVYTAVRGPRPVFHRHPVVVLGATWLLGLAAAALSSSITISGEAITGRWLPAHWSSFALGMVLAEVHHGGAGRAARVARSLAAYPGTCLALAGGAYLLATTTVAGPLTLGPVTGVQLALKTVLSSVVTAGLMLPLLFGDGRDHLSRALASPSGQYLGRISYGIFLWHLPVFEAFFAVTGIPYFQGGALALIAIGVPLTLLIAALSERWVEGPAMDWAHSRTRRRTPPATPPPGR